MTNHPASGGEVGHAARTSCSLYSADVKKRSILVPFEVQGTSLGSQIRRRIGNRASPSRSVPTIRCDLVSNSPLADHLADSRLRGVVSLLSLPSSSHDPCARVEKYALSGSYAPQQAAQPLQWFCPAVHSRPRERPSQDKGW